jgi:type II secretory pathway pseudopilin PulG
MKFSLPNRENRRGDVFNRFSMSGFTLLEVILAVTIAIGIMTVALYFYQQSSTLRKQALEEMERIAAVRLVMDRLGMELRCAVNGSELLPGLSGTSSSIEFTRLEPPVKGSLITNAMGQTSPSRLQPTYKKMIYRIGGGSDGLSVLERSEENITLKSSSSASGQTNSASMNTASTNNVDSFLSNFDLLSGATNLFSSETSSTNTDEYVTSDIIYAGDSLWNGDTNLRDSEGYMAMEGFIDEGTNRLQKVAVNTVFAKGIGYFNLRYYDGSQWVNSWNQKELPLGVEIRIASEDPETEEAKVEKELQEQTDSFESAFDLTSETAGSDTNSTASIGNELPNYNNDRELIPTDESVLSSGLDTNVVVFQRIIFLPNAKKKVTSGTSSTNLFGTGSEDLFDTNPFGMEDIP